MVTCFFQSQNDPSGYVVPVTVFRQAERGWFNEEWDDFRNLIVHAYIAISERYANEYAQKYPQLADEVAKIRADPEGTLAFVRPMLRAAMEEE